MILKNEPIILNNKNYDIYIQVTSKDGNEPHGYDLHLMLERVKEAIEVYQGNITDSFHDDRMKE